MSKTIKLEDSTYEKLERFRGKRETFSQAVERLLDIHEALGRVEDIIEGQTAFREGQRERLNQQKRRDDLPDNLTYKSTGIERPEP